LKQEWTPEDAARELVRGRMEIMGPVTAWQIARSLNLSSTTLIEGGLLRSSEGRILRGNFTSLNKPSPSALPSPSTVLALALDRPPPSPRPRPPKANGDRSARAHPSLR
jgi:hypothetical protein